MSSSVGQKQMNVQTCSEISQHYLHPIFYIKDFNFAVHFLQTLGYDHLSNLSELVS